MATKKIIKPQGIAEAAGPFVRAVLIDNHLYIAGTTALSHVSGNYYERAVPPTIEAQTRLTLENLRKCVEAAGGIIDDIFKVVIMLRDPEHYTRMNSVRAEYFKREPPISTCFRAELMRDDILIEIDAEALIGARLVDQG